MVLWENAKTIALLYTILWKAYRKAKRLKTIIKLAM